MEDSKHERAKVYVYTRVSTAMQVDGYSLDAQKDEIMRYVHYKNMQVCGEYTDEGKSGKNIQGRPGFQQMMNDIANKKDNISFIICFKLSRFGRNTADILNSIKLMKRYGTHLICVKENIDSSRDSGKMMISILGAMAEIERDNIAVQTMAGRKEKAKQGGWNGSIAPYGYHLENGKLIVVPELAEHIKLIYDKYVNTNLGMHGVANWMNEHGYVKKATTHNGLSVFTVKFVDDVLSNYTYCGKITYGKTKTVLREGSEDEYHKIETDDFMIFEGQHEAIIPESIWDAAQRKRKTLAVKNEIVDKEHQYIYSTLIKCPICGKSLYGVPMKRDKKKDGSLYPRYYAYGCHSHVYTNGIDCNYGQISGSKIDKFMHNIISSVVNDDTFRSAMNKIVDQEISSDEVDKELKTATKAFRQATGLQKKLETELDNLDVTDKLYDYKYESLNRRLESAFKTIEETDAKVTDCKARIEAIKNQMLSAEKACECLKVFSKQYDKMSDFEKKSFANAFIDSIELYPDKKGRNGCPIKTVHFKFPVSYDGGQIYNLSPCRLTTDDRAVL